MKRQDFAFLFFVVSVVSAAFFYTAFFHEVASAVSEWTGSGFIWPYQLFHNFLHGRPFQSSLFAFDDGTSVGFVGHYGFINANVIHVNWLPYLFAPLWGLSQTPQWFYGIQVLWCLTLTPWFAVSIVRRLDPENWKPKAAFIVGVLLSSGLLSIINQMGQLLVFCGPLMLAVYDAVLARKRFWFFFWFILLLSVSEDAAMVGCMLAGYVVLFEPKFRREGVWAAALGGLYTAFVLFVLQPAARAELKVLSASTTSFIAPRLFHLGPKVLAANLYSMIPISTLLPALGLAVAVFGGIPAAEALRVAALAVIPAFPHWGECLVVGGAHHQFPPYFGLYLALAVLVGRARSAGWAPKAVAAWTLVYAGVSLRALAGNLPPELKLPILRRLRPSQAAALERSLSGERASNLDLIETLRSIPLDQSLCYLGNDRPAGYVSARADVWMFPEFYDKTRYLLIQKDAVDEASQVDEPRPGETLEAMVARLPPSASVRDVPLPQAAVALIRRALVDERKTHRVAREDEHVLLLKNLKPDPPVGDATTYGFGWVKNLGKRPQRIQAAGR